MFSTSHFMLYFIVMPVFYSFECNEFPKFHLVGVE